MSSIKDTLGDTPYAERYPHGPGYARGSETSRAAAESIRRSTGPMHQKILDHLTDVGTTGATNEEIATATGLRLQTVCGRIAEMVADTKVRRSTRRRIGASGRFAAVNVLASLPEP